VIAHPIVAGAVGPQSAGAVRLAAALAELTGSTLVQAGADDACLPQELARVARQVDASVLVVGPDPDIEVARGVLHRAPCPILVTPRDASLPGEAGLREIGVAFDGSASARRAVTVAQHLALRARAHLTLVAVGPDAPGDELETIAAGLAQTVGVGILRPLGRPERQLVGASSAFDLLVCGSHGHDPPARRVLGPVAEHLMRAAHCPVLIVPVRCRHHAATPLGVTTAGG
jgi:nucleotide-binding universal stress UspA family protein